MGGAAGASLKAGTVILLLLLCVLVGILTGCGIGARDFSGGGVPIGGSRLFGRVVAASDPTTSLSNVAVKVEATPTGGTTKTLEMRTGQSGAFDFSDVLPGFSSGTVEVTATPSDAGYGTQQVTFQVFNGHTVQMLVTLPTASFDQTTAKTLSLSLPSPAIPSGETVQLQAQLRDEQGKPLPVTPTLAFEGDFGMLNANGSFTVPRGILSGTGTITAYWESLTPQSVQIHVDNHASSQPPPIPMLPNTTGDPGH